MTQSGGRFGDVPPPRDGATATLRSEVEYGTIYEERPVRG